VAATNVNLLDAIEKGRFREDLYYRLNTVPIRILPLRDRTEDVHLLFRKFASDFADKYRMPAIRLDNEAVSVLLSYGWPGNVRQLKNITEQISIIEKERIIDAKTLQHYIPLNNQSKLPALYHNVDEKTFASEREILYQILFDIKRDMNDLKKLVHDILQNEATLSDIRDDNAQLIRKLYQTENGNYVHEQQPTRSVNVNPVVHGNILDTEEFVEESLSLEYKEIEMIQKALEKHKGKRKYAARELGISERTLYRKIKEYDID
jgi:DNA-binding NtrC family response regulator